MGISQGSFKVYKGLLSVVVQINAYFLKSFTKLKEREAQL